MLSVFKAFIMRWIAPAAHELFSQNPDCAVIELSKVVGGLSSRDIVADPP